MAGFVRFPVDAGGRRNAFRPPLFARDLAKALAAVATRMEPTAASEICTRTVHKLAEALALASDFSSRRSLTEALAAVATHIESGEAARVLAEILSKTDTAYHDIVTSLVAVTARMEPKQAAEICAKAARILVGAIEKRRGVAASRYFFALALADLATRLEPVTALGIQTRAVLLHADQFATTVFDPDTMQNFTTAVFGLATTDRQRRRHATALVAGVFSTPHNVLPSLALLHPHFHPQPRLLPPQDLVELLKHPFCVGEARRAVLEALEFTYKRSFKDQWELVEYVQRNNVHDHTTGKPLDLLTPPKRPEQKP